MLAVFGGQKRSNSKANSVVILPTVRIGYNGNVHVTKQK